jgi:hypothetical protein
VIRAMKILEIETVITPNIPAKKLLIFLERDGGTPERANKNWI